VVALIEFRTSAVATALWAVSVTDENTAPNEMTDAGPLAAY